MVKSTITLFIFVTATLVVSCMAQDRFSLSDGWTELADPDYHFRDVNDWMAVKADGTPFIYKMDESEYQLFMKADTAYHIRQYEDARQSFLKVINNYPQNWYAYLYLGDTFHIWDQFDTARVWFDRAVQVNPYNWKSWRYLSETQYCLKDTLNALKSVIRSIILNPHSFESWSHLSFLGSEYKAEMIVPADSAIFFLDTSSKKFFIHPKIENALFIKDVRPSLKAYLNTYHLNQSDYFGFRAELEFWRSFYSWLVLQWDMGLEQSRWTESQQPYVLENIRLVYYADILDEFIIWTHLLWKYPESSTLMTEDEIDHLVEFYYELFIYQNRN